MLRFPAPEDEITVVLVDDHQIALEGLSRMLERHGMSVVAATGDPDLAVASVGRERPSLCVIDLRLGDSSGVDLVRKVRAACSETRVAILTSFEDGRAARLAVEAGASGFVIKDASAPELCEQLRSIAAGGLVIDRRVVNFVLQPASTGLTQQERAVLQLVAEGETNRAIAEVLHLSPHTVKDHVSKVMRKLGAKTRAETVARALQQGLI